MSRTIPRRRLIELSLAGVTLLVTGCEDAVPMCAPLSVLTERQRGADLQGVEEIAEWLLSVEDSALVPELRSRLAGGWSVDAAFAALLVTGARYIDSKLGGGAFHFVLQVFALRSMSLRAPPDEALVPLVFGMLGTRRAIANNPWELPPVDLDVLPPAAEGAERLIAATEAGRVDEALRAVTALARAGDVQALHETLLEVGTRRARGGE